MPSLSGSARVVEIVSGCRAADSNAANGVSGTGAGVVVVVVVAAA